MKDDLQPIREIFADECAKAGQSLTMVVEAIRENNSHGSVQAEAILAGIDRLAPLLRDAEQTAELERLRGERDGLLWLLRHEYERENPGEVMPDFLTVVRSLREAADAAGGAEMNP